MHESSSRFEALYILGINVASFVLLYQEYQSNVLFRQASNPHWSIIWIISGPRTLVRMFARIFAPSFLAAVHWNELLSVYGAVTDLCNELSEYLRASVKPEAPDHLEAMEILCTVRRSNSMFSSLPLKCKDLYCHVLCFVILLSRRHWRHETLGGQILRNLPSCSLHFGNKIRRDYQCRFRTISFMVQASRKTNDREEIFRAHFATVCELCHIFLYFLFLPM